MRVQRIQEVQRAKEISDEIDNQLMVKRNALKKRQKMGKLLGQSESRVASISLTQHIRPRRSALFRRFRLAVARI